MKREFLFQTELHANSSLREALEQLSIEQLQGILFYIQLQEPCTEEKETLIKQIEETLPKAIHRFALCFDLERFKIFQILLEQDGVMPADGLSIQKILSFQEMGMAFPALCGDQRVLVVPQEVREMFATLDKDMWQDVAMCNTRILRRVHGLLQYYGFLETKTLLRFCVEKEPDAVWDNIYFLELLYAAILYYGTIEPEEDGFRHKRLWNFEYIKNKQEEFHCLPEYKVFPISVMEQVGKGIVWTPPMEQLKQFLIKGGLSKNLAKREVESAWYELNNGISLDDVCEYLMDWYFVSAPNDTRDALTLHLHQMFCTMPQWMLKGYSLNELSEIEEMKE